MRFVARDGSRGQLSQRERDVANIQSIKAKRNLGQSSRSADGSPGSRYYSKEFAAKEWEHVWTKSWLMVGRDVEIPESGDFLVEDIGPESILVVRQKDGGIRAFYNVCRHRGNQLVGVHEGSLDRFTCSYHGWKWALDGACVGAQDEDDFPNGSPCGRLRLSELRCEVFATFIWINMDPDCIPLLDFLGEEVVAGLGGHPFAGHVRTQAMSVRVPCNWKFVNDNFRETYHIPTCHPCALYLNDPDYRKTDVDLFEGGHGRLRTSGGMPSIFLPGGKLAIDEPLLSDLKHWGLDPDDFKGREQDTRLALQKQKRKLGAERGHAHYAQLGDAQLTDTIMYSVFPNVNIALFADSFVLLRAIPHAKDPEQCTFDSWYYAIAGVDDVFTRTMTSNASVEGATAQHAPREWINFGEKSLGAILDGDTAILLAQQLGSHSLGYHAPEFSNQEKRVRQYHDRIDALIRQGESAI